MGVTGYFRLFLETRRENETFKKYNDGGGCVVCYHDNASNYVYMCLMV